MVDGQQLIGDLPHTYKKVITMIKKIKNTQNNTKRLIAKLKIFTLAMILVVNNGIILVNSLSDVESELLTQKEFKYSIDQLLFFN